jgi:HPt (histidine-containing phosphotransfer) domain-containing protein
LDASTVKSLYGCSETSWKRTWRAALAAAQADGEACVRLIHKIKGTSASYRATRLHELASEADGLFKQRQTSSAARLLPEVLAAGGTVCQHIDRWQE